MGQANGRVSLKQLSLTAYRSEIKPIGTVQSAVGMYISDLSYCRDLSMSKERSVVFTVNGWKLDIVGAFWKELRLAGLCLIHEKSCFCNLRQPQ